MRRAATSVSVSTPTTFASCCCGAELPIGKWTEQLAAIRSRRAELDKLVGTLRGLADLVEGAYPVIVREAEQVAGGAA